MKNKTISDYTIQHLLGSGGMAEVWYAENTIGKKAAVKILKQEYTSHTEVVKRFENEARIMVKLEHYNIRKVYSYGFIENRPAIIMEYLEGEDLSKKLEKSTPYTNSDMINWWNQAVEALNYTHQKGIVHRDIKPSNLFITESGELKLLDFGIAKVREGFTLTQTGQTMGTPLYMSPEQVKDSKHIDYKTDIYSLAVSFVRLVSKKMPYELPTDASRFEIEQKIVFEKIDTTYLPEPWNHLLSNYLNKEATQRGELKPYIATESNHKKEEVKESEKTVITPTTKGETLITPSKKDKEINDKPKKEVTKGKTYLYIFIVSVFLIVGGVFFWNTSKDIEETENTLPTLIPYRKGDKWGFCDKDKNIVIPVKYDGAWTYSEGLAGVILDNKQGLIDKTGKEVVPIKYDEVWDFSEGLAIVGLNEKYGVIDKKGKEVIPLKYDYVENFSEGLTRVKLNGKVSFIDKNGKEITPIKYDGTSYFSEGLAKVESNGKYGFIDKTGKEVIPLKYDSADNFSEGLAMIRLNGKYGFINKTGKEVIPLKYDFVDNFSEDLAVIVLNDKWGFIDKNGKEVIPPKYDFAYPFFSEGLTLVGLNGKRSFIDKTGKEIIPFKYSNEDSFSEGLVQVGLNGKYGFIDKTGKEVIPLKYDSADNFSEGLARVELNGKYGYIDKNGTEYWED